MELRGGQLWAIEGNEGCEYSRCLYIDWADEQHFNSREFVHGKCITAMHDVKYLTGDSRWRLLNTEDCYYLLVRHNELSKQCAEMKRKNDEVKARAAELNDEIARMKSEKRTKCGVLVYVNNIKPVLVDCGISWNWRDEYLYVYDVDYNCVGQFRAEFVFGVSLGGDDVSK